MKIRNPITAISEIPLVKSGDPITATWANAIARSVRELSRRTPVLTGLNNRKIVKRLPFEISTRNGNIVAAGGTVGFEPFAEIEEIDPDAGDWFFQVKVTIDGDTASILSTVAEWTTDPSSSTPTEYSQVIGKITVLANGPDPRTIEQYNYGPIQVTLFGGIEEKWNVVIY